MTDPAAIRRSAVRVVRRLQEAGFTAYWAGGCVRDQLMGKTPYDYDMATDAGPDRVLALFPGSVAVGKAFGVVRVPLDGAWFETATFREDHGYADGRRPREVSFSDARTDAGRRDFTVNALFYDPVAGRVHDFVGGRADIDARLIRCVGEPAARMREDYLRLIRAARFGATLEFDIHPDTAAAVRANAAHLAEVSAERVRDELTRLLLEAPRAGDGLRLLDALGLLAVVLPEIKAMQGQAQPPQFHPEGDVFEHTALMLNRMRTEDPCLAWAVLLHDVGKPPTARETPERIRFDRHSDEGADMAEGILKRLRFSTDAVRTIVYAIRNHMRFMHVQEMRPATLRRLIGAPTFPLELELHRLDCLASHGELDNYDFLCSQRQRYRRQPPLPPPWISGHDIMALGVPEGPRVGRWRKTAYDAQLEGRFSDRETLLHWLRGEIDQIED